MIYFCIDTTIEPDYARFLEQQLTKQCDQQKLAHAITTPLQAFQSILKHPTKASTTVAVGDAIWLVSIITTLAPLLKRELGHVLHHLPPVKQNLPLFVQRPLMIGHIQKAIRTIAARKLISQPVFRANDQFFLDQITLVTDSGDPTNIHIDGHGLKSEYHLQTPANRLQCTAQVNPEHKTTPIIQFAAYSPTRASSGTPLLQPSQLKPIKDSTNDPNILHIPVTHVQIRSQTPLHLAGQLDTTFTSTIVIESLDWQLPMIASKTSPSDID